MKSYWCKFAMWKKTALYTGLAIGLLLPFSLANFPATANAKPVPHWYVYITYFGIRSTADDGGDRVALLTGFDESRNLKTLWQGLVKPGDSIPTSDQRRWHIWVREGQHLSIICVRYVKVHKWHFRVPVGWVYIYLKPPVVPGEFQAQFAHDGAVYDLHYNVVPATK